MSPRSDDIRHPGLGHSYTWAGEWLETNKALPPLRERLDPKGLAKKRKLERLSDLNSRQGTLWDALADR